MSISATASILANGSAKYLPGSFIVAESAFSGGAGRDEQHRTTWDINEPGSQEKMFSLAWMVPYVAGTPFTVNRYLSSDLIGHRIALVLEEPGSMSLTPTTVDAEGTASVATAVSGTVLGWDAYNHHLFVDAASTATGGIPIADTFAGASATLDGRIPTTDIWQVSWVNAAGTIETSGGKAVTTAIYGGNKRSASVVAMPLDTYTAEATFRWTVADGSNKPTGIMCGGNKGGLFSYSLLIAGLSWGVSPTVSIVLGDTALFSTPFTPGAPSIDTDYTVRVERDGLDIEVYVDDVLYLSETLTSGQIATKYVGIGAHKGMVGGIEFDSFEVSLPTGAGSSESDALPTFDMLSSIIGSRELDGMLVEIKGGTHTGSATTALLGTNICLKALDLNNRPTIDFGSGSHDGFYFGQQGVTTTSRRIMVWGLDFKGTGRTDKGFVFRTSTAGACIDCGVYQCKYTGTDREFSSWYEDSPVSGTRLIFIDNDNSGVEFDRYSYGQFGSGDSYLYANLMGTADTERPQRYSGNGYLAMLWNHSNDTTGGKSEMRIQACAGSIVAQNLFGNLTCSLGGDTGNVYATRFEGNVLHGISQQPSGVNPTDGLIICSNIIKKNVLSLQKDSTSNVVVAHNTFFRDTTTTDYLSSGTTGDYINNIAALDAGITITRVSSVRLQVPAADSALIEATFTNNCWPLSSKSTDNTGAFYEYSGNNGKTFTDWLALSYVSGDEEKDITVDANMVPSYERDVTVPDGVHVDFFRRAIVPGSTAWGGAVMAGITPPTIASSTPANGATGVAANQPTIKIHWSTIGTQGTAGSKFYLHDAADDSILATIPSDTCPVNALDKVEQTVTLGITIGEGKSVYLLWDAGVFVTQGTSTPNAANTDKTALAFSTESAPGSSKTRSRDRSRAR